MRKFMGQRNKKSKLVQVVIYADPVKGRIPVRWPVIA